ncbi:MAG TPA: TRAP transporter substrate-binding protein [Thermodesulfobacteriota bacterium]|nr:TRAP transporter substrate-binding protein [Thermodesulfobacteriota bacterium]
MKKVNLGLICGMLLIAIVLTGFESTSLTSLSSAVSMFSAVPAAAQTSVKPVKLKFATHLPSIHHNYKNVISPLAAEITKRTEGRVQVVTYADGQLGKASELYDALLNGTVDISWIIPGFHTGRFPLESVFHLPTLVPGAVGDPTCTAIRTMVYEKYLIPRYFKDVKILYTGRFGLDNLLMAEKPVRKLEDMKGKVMGFGGGATPPLIFSALGASSESIQTHEIYTSLEKKIVDGTYYPFDALAGLRLSEVVKYGTRVDFGSASNFTAIRKGSWDKLSPADQKIITDLIPWALERQANSYKGNVEVGLEAGKKAGMELIELSPAERQRWVDALKPIELKWIAEMDAAGLPGSQIYNDILQLKSKK